MADAEDELRRVEWQQATDRVCEQLSRADRETVRLVIAAVEALKRRLPTATPARMLEEITIAVPHLLPHGDTK